MHRRILPGPPADLSRGRALLLLGLVMAATLTLGTWELRYGLPAILHSDSVQALQGAELLREGSVRDWTVYPPTLVFGYAAADMAAYVTGRALGWEGYAGWDAFVQHLAQPVVHESIGRVFGAVMAALLAVGVYRLARVRFDRRVAVLAAALAALCPAQTLYAHQVRPHVPTLTLLVLLAPAVLRLAVRPGARRALLAGLAAGLVNAVFQVGLPLLAVALGFLLLFARPLRALCVQAACVAAGFAFGWQAIEQGMQATGLLVRDDAANAVSQTFWSARGFDPGMLWAGVGRVPEQWWQWVTTEPLRATAVLLFFALCRAGARSWRDALLYGAFPFVVLLVLALLQGVHLRYAMYATPFLVVLASSAALAPRRPAWRAVLVVLLVAAPLGSSMRLDQLLGRGDSRLSLLAVLPELVDAGLRVTVSANLAPSGAAMPEGVDRFPPRGDFMPWRNGEERPQDTLLTGAPDVFAQRLRSTSKWSLRPEQLERVGYRRVGRTDTGADFEFDAPRRVVPDLWLARQLGPPIDVWARAAVAERVRKLLPEGMRAASDG